MVTLLSELQRKEWTNFTVCRMAKADLERGDLDAALARLRVDADKLRTLDSPLHALVMAG